VGPPDLFIEGVSMSTQMSPFGALIDLVNFDTYIRQLRNSVTHVSTEIETLKKLFESQETAKKVALRSVIEAKKRVDEAELFLSEIDLTLQAKKKLLDTLSDYKEFRPLKLEIDQIGSQLHEQELLVESAWKILETTEIDSIKQIKKIEDTISDLQKSLQEKTDLLRQKQLELEGNQTKRTAKESLVPDEWLLKYNTMQERVEDPVVPIEQNSCTVCFSHITGNNLLQAKRGTLVQCTSCYRLLFLPAAMESLKNNR